MAFCKDCGSPAPPPNPTAVDAEDEAWSQPSEPAGLSAFDAPTAGSWWRDHRLILASRTFLVFALLGTGVLVGWAFGSDESLVEAERPAAVDTADPDGRDPAAAGPSMPDVRGLSAHDARQILADAGIPASSVSTADQPAAGESGVVLDQDPVYGYAVDGAVTLAVSTEARVPQFRGRSADDVLADLDQLGAEVETQSVFVPGVPVGQVASIDPAPGTVLPVDVTVVIAAEPDRLGLLNVVPVDDTCYTDEDSIGGITFGNVFTCSTDRSPEAQSWVIKRAAHRLTGVVGIVDSGRPAEQMLVEVLGDGTVLHTITARYGESTRLNLDLTGVLRLTVRYRSLTNDYATLGLGRLTLLGDAGRLRTVETY